MAAPDRLDDLVSAFVAQLRDVIRDEIRETLDGRFSGSGGAARVASSSPSRSNGHSRGKGVKRDPAELEALQAKFLAFVTKNPGLRIEQINKQLGDTNTKDLMLPVKKLIAEKKIVAKGNRRATVYMPAGSKKRKSTK